MEKIREVNGARCFTANCLYDAGMRVAESVDGDAAKKIEILFSSGIEDIGATAVSHNHGLALVSGQKELLGVEKAQVRFGGSCTRSFCFSRVVYHRFLFGRSLHHAAE
jgi:hypothetical protein